MSGGELAAAEEKLNSSEPTWRNSIVEEKQKRLITAQAYYMRANQMLDDRTKLEDCLPMARALFGEDLENAIETLHHQFHIVRTYADAYVDDYNGTDRDFTVKIRRALFARTLSLTASRSSPRRAASPPRTTPGSSPLLWRRREPPLPLRGACFERGGNVEDRTGQYHPIVL